VRSSAGDSRIRGQRYEGRVRDFRAFGQFGLDEARQGNPGADRREDISSSAEASADYAKSDRPVARTASDVQNSNPSVAIRGTRSSFIRLATSLKRASVFGELRFPTMVAGQRRDQTSIVVKIQIGCFLLPTIVRISSA
jgi:hypothetical protein